MTLALEALHSTGSIAKAEQDLGAELQSVSTGLISPAEMALHVCMNAPEYITGPFVGFKKVLAKNNKNPQDKQTFLETVQSLDGRVLLLPTRIGTIHRTLIRSIPSSKEVMLSIYNSPATLSLLPAEKTLLSALDGYNDPTIGTHIRGIRTEPGHIALTSAVVLGAAKVDTDLHDAIHAYEHKTGAAGNILAGVAQTPRFLGVGLSVKQFTYETWPTAMELLWHPEERSVHAANEEDAVARVQAAGFAELREKKLVGVTLHKLEGMK